MIYYANDLDVDHESSTVFFSDSSRIAPIYDTKTGLWSTMKAALTDLFTGYPTGRLLTYNLDTKQSDELLNNISYANGVALSLDKSFVLVAETGRARILRYWLKGEKSFIFLFCCRDCLLMSINQRAQEKYFLKVFQLFLMEYQ